MAKIFNIVLFCVIGLSAQCGADYYWRDWNGTIPRDIFLASTDNTRATYIAQAYIINSGLFAGHIFSGQEEIVINPTTLDGPVTTSNILKVLCSANPHSLMWVPSNTTLTPGFVDFTFPVKGGITVSKDPVYIGRYNNGSYTHIGSIHTDNFLYFSYINSDNAIGGYKDTYDLLIHAKQRVD